MVSNLIICFLLFSFFSFFCSISLVISCLVCCNLQEVFKRAIIQPGPPESFALQTVQEVIKPQVCSLF